MTDKELIARLRDLGRSFPNWQDGIDAADRIEALLRREEKLGVLLSAAGSVADIQKQRAERLEALLDRAVNGPWLDGDLERARAALTQKEPEDD